MRTRDRLALVVAVAFVSFVPAAFAPASEPVRDGGGFLIHNVTSPFQEGETAIRVLVPDRVDDGARLPVVYVLPVEAGEENRYGDGLLEVKARNLHGLHRAVFVAPSFSQLPWYADHPTDPLVRQETYFRQVVVPFVERHYHVKAGAEGRYLLGFSKSGWGAFSLLLRHPDEFAGAAAWDAPLMMDRLGKYGSGPVFGTDENFKAYRLTTLLARRGAELGGRPRLFHLGYGNFRGEHEAFEALLNELEIPHRYADGPKREHTWSSGWVPEAVGLLLQEH